VGADSPHRKLLPVSGCWFFVCHSSEELALSAAERAGIQIAGGLYPAN